MFDIATCPPDNCPSVREGELASKVECVIVVEQFLSGSTTVEGVLRVHGMCNVESVWKKCSEGKRKME